MPYRDGWRDDKHAIYNLLFFGDLVIRHFSYSQFALCVTCHVKLSLLIQCLYLYVMYWPEINKEKNYEYLNENLLTSLLLVPRVQSYGDVSPYVCFRNELLHTDQPDSSSIVTSSCTVLSSIGRI